MVDNKRQKLQKTLSLVSSGHSIQDIAQELNVSSGVVYSYLRELGLGGGKWKYVKGQPRQNPSIEVMEVKRLYDSGLTIRGIAEKLKVSQTTIHNKLKSVNYVPSGQSSQFIDIDMDAVKEAYESGKTWSEVAQDFKISTKTLRKKVQASNLNIPSRVTRVALPNEELLSNYKAGLPIGYLASKYKVHRATIIRRLKRLGAKLSIKS